MEKRSSDNDSFFLDDSKDQPINHLTLQSSHAANPSKKIFLDGGTHRRFVGDKRPMDVLIKGKGSNKLAFTEDFQDYLHNRNDST